MATEVDEKSSALTRVAVAFAAIEKGPRRDEV